MVLQREHGKQLTIKYLPIFTHQFLAAGSSTIQYISRKVDIVHNF